MYENTHFPTAEQAIQYGIEEYKAGEKLTLDRIEAMNKYAKDNYQEEIDRLSKAINFTLKPKQMKPKLRRTTIRGFGNPLFQYVFTIGIFYLGARYSHKNERWKYQIGVGDEKYWFFPPFMLNLKKRPLITNLYVLTVFLFIIYIFYFVGFQILVILGTLDIVLFKWLRQPSKEVSYITTMFWFLLALIFIAISFAT